MRTRKNQLKQNTSRIKVYFNFNYIVKERINCKKSEIFVLLNQDSNNKEKEYLDSLSNKINKGNENKENNYSLAINNNKFRCSSNPMIKLINSNSYVKKNVKKVSILSNKFEHMFNSIDSDKNKALNQINSKFNKLVNAFNGKKNI